MHFKKILVYVFLFSVSNVLASENRHDLIPEIMLDSADSMRSLTLGALQYNYHINQSYWVGVDSFFGKTVVDSGSGLTVKNGEMLWGVSPIFYWNLPALLGATKDNPDGAQCELYTSFGVGYLHFETDHSIYGTFGGGMQWISSAHWIGVRVDVKGLFYMLNNAGGSRFNTDFALSLGPVFSF